jgi:hypothetical protein
MKRTSVLQQHRLQHVAVSAAVVNTPRACAACFFGSSNALLLVVLVVLQAFYNGFMPNFARLGSWNVAMFLMLEQVGAGGWQMACRPTSVLQERVARCQG